MGTNHFNLDTTAINNVTFNSIGILGTNQVSNFDDALRAFLASTKSHMLDMGGANTVGGTADAITITTASGTVDALYDGLMIGVRIGADNTLTNPTVAVGGLSAKLIEKSVRGVETALAAGDMQTGQFGYLVYRSAWNSAAGAFEWCPMGYDPEGYIATGDAGELASLLLSTDGTDQTALEINSDLGVQTGRYLRIKTPTSDSATEPFIFNSNNAIAFEIDSTQIIDIDSTGNIYITPTSRLDLSGDLYMNANDIYTEAGRIYGFDSADYLEFGTNNQVAIHVNGSTYFQFNHNGFWIIDNVFKVQERTAARADSTGYGQFWVKNDIPNVPMFTDDAGNDGQIHTSYGDQTFGRDVFIDRQGDTADAILYFRADAGEAERIVFQTGTSNRWHIIKDADAESGSDVGSDFALLAYDDAGSYIDNPLHINREAGGWVTFNRTVQVSGGLAETLLYFDADLGVNNDRYLSLSAPNSDSTTDSFDWNTANSVAWLVDGSTTLRLNSNKNVEVLAGDLEVDRVGDADDAHLILNSDVGKWSRILFESNDLNRWRIGKDISTESGSNVGSDFRIDAYDDVGAFIDTPIEIQREAGGNIDFSRDVYMNANDFYTEAGLIYGANTNDYLDLASGDLGIYVNSVRRLRVQSGRFYSDVPFYLKEAAAAGGDVAAYGQLWVKNTTPCQLWFTDDTGTDTQIV